MRKKTTSKMFFCAILASLSLSLVGCITLVPPSSSGSDSNSNNPNSSVENPPEEIPSKLTMSEGIAVEYNAISESYTITGIGTCDENVIKLSSIYEGKPVTKIKDSAFENCKQLTKVEIDDGIKSIGKKAFFKCTNLVQVTLGKEVNAISDNAFTSCNNLLEICNASELSLECGQSLNGGIALYANKIVESEEELSAVEIADGFIYLQGEDDYALCGYIGEATTITIPATYKEKALTIREYALFETAVENIHIPAQMTDFGFLKQIELKELHSPKTLQEWCLQTWTEESFKPLESGAKLFLDGTLLEGELTVDFEVKDYALYGYQYLTDITITSDCTALGVGAFGNCLGVKTFVNESAFTTIPEKLLYNCRDLETLDLGTDVKEIGNEAFYWCDSLMSLTIPSSVESIGNRAFYKAVTLTELVVPGTVKTVGDEAFSFSENIETLELQEGIESIGASTFNTCKKLTSIIIPDSITYLGNQAFRYCEKLAFAYIGDGITVLREGTFSKCPALQTVSWGTNIRFIQINAFGGDFNNDYEYCMYYYRGTKEEYKENLKYRQEFTDGVGTQVGGINDQHITMNGTGNVYKKPHKLFYYTETEPTATQFAELNQVSSKGNPIEGYWHYDENNKPVIWEKSN